MSNNTKSSSWSVFGSWSRSAPTEADAAKGETTDPTQAASFFELSATDMQGNVVPMATYRDKVCLVVNVASQ
ncbi:Aste57867_12894 [Aphanomyces stellatus]|uniref:Aste57867_12894 protein n=1 Tax=Aphanomyces stellatus TaxID=120398 RepID=A0A485KXK1_9STRA|nr:hypothetical protein As57867_012846 [Aphanomyces stellatus]VFT89741.1 Aste57867_12894 [Aphanomyces stellatus]